MSQRGVPDQSYPESFIPLSKDVFHILVSLADRQRHGYSVMQDVAERTSGTVKLSPSSLYSAIRRLLEQGLIDEREGPADDDERRRYYKLTKLGRAVALAEGRRMEHMLTSARKVGLMPGRE